MIYFLQEPKTRLVKIGFTNNFPERRDALEKRYGKLKLLGTMQGDVSFERSLHIVFSHLQPDDILDGREWFGLGNDLKLYIESNTSSGIGNITIPVSEFLEMVHAKEKESHRLFKATELAQEIGGGITVKQVRELFKGNTIHVKSDTVFAFCEYFHCQVGDLLIYEEGDEPIDLEDDSNQV